MFLSTFNIFKVGIGPSSSHTMGPMIASLQFLKNLKESLPPNVREQITKFHVSLHGSLAFTGVGHHSDRAAILGLLGHDPKHYDRIAADADLHRLNSNLVIKHDFLPNAIHFNPPTDLIFDFDLGKVDLHPNGMKLLALDDNDDIVHEEIYYSIGGGFIKTEKQMLNEEDEHIDDDNDMNSVPYPFETSSEMIMMSLQSNKTIAEMKLENELSKYTRKEVEDGINEIWNVMNNCIYRGLNNVGILPGGLKVKRRAMKIHQQLLEEKRIGKLSPHASNEWLSTYAMAVNEENACGGQVVTSPTNGAAGVVPATLKYYLEHIPDSGIDKISEFLLTASAIGGLIKHKASISGAECGCQAEIGSASAMAAAGLCAILGGSTMQIENAAEIALEHHLGMTCDPVGGLVQVPCIERNGVGAIKAVSAASLALRGDGTHLISLDACIKTMKETGEDMHSNYKETSLGGLAVNVPNC